MTRTCESFIWNRKTLRNDNKICEIVNFYVLYMLWLEIWCNTIFNKKNYEIEFSSLIHPVYKSEFTWSRDTKQTLLSTFSLQTCNDCIFIIDNDIE